MTTNKKSNADAGGMGIGTGLVAAGAALAAGYYFYMSDDAKKHRKMLVHWATDLKEEIMDKAEALKENLNRESLMGIIDDVAETYYTAKNVSKEDVMQAVDELKENWSKVMEELKKSKKKSVSSIKSVGSKAKLKRRTSGA